MAWFDDTRLKDIYDGRLAAGISSEDCSVIRRKLRILMAARSSKSHWVAGMPFTTLDGRPAIRISEKWAISFEWIDEVGPFRMRLES